MQRSNYVIDGGAEGRNRLRILADVFGPATRALLSRVGIPEGATCLDLGCGDVTRELAQMLPGHLRDAGFEDVNVHLHHPVALRGGIKTLTCTTLEKIGATVLRDNLTTEEEFNAIRAELFAFADDTSIVMGRPCGQLGLPRDPTGQADLKL